MILRAMGLGFVLWLAAAAGFRFGADWFFRLDEVLWLYVATAPVMAALTFLLLKALRVSRGDEAEAAIGLAAPGLLLNVYAVAHFTEVFPNIDYLLVTDYAALILLGYGAALVTGVLMTRLSPADERVAGFAAPAPSDTSEPAP